MGNETMNIYERFLRGGVYNQKVIATFVPASFNTPSRSFESMPTIIDNLISSSVIYVSGDSFNVGDLISRMDNIPYKESKELSIIRVRFDDYYSHVWSKEVEKDPNWGLIDSDLFERKI